MSREQYKDMSDHDMLIEVCIRGENLEKQFTNHLHHHWMVTIAALGAALTGAIGFVMSIIMLLIKSGVLSGT